MDINSIFGVILLPPEFGVFSLRAHWQILNVLVHFVDSPHFGGHPLQVYAKGLGVTYGHELGVQVECGEIVLRVVIDVQTLVVVVILGGGGVVALRLSGHRDPVHLQLVPLSDMAGHYARLQPDAPQLFSQILVIPLACFVQVTRHLCLPLRRQKGQRVGHHCEQKQKRNCSEQVVDLRVVLGVKLFKACWVPVYHFLRNLHI